MTQQAYIEQMAIRFGTPINKPESPAIRKILACAMSEEEARFLLDLPAPTADLAAKYGISEAAIEARLLAMAKRGLVISSRKGPRLPSDLTTLHDSIMASGAAHIPQGIGAHWRELYDGEDWAADIGNFLSQFPMTPIRTIPVLDSVAAEAGKLAPHEDIEAIIRANAELISIRECCCRNAAGKCGHPNDVCMQFGRRAKYDLYRGSGRQVSACELAAPISMTAVRPPAFIPEKFIGSSVLGGGGPMGS